MHDETDFLSVRRQFDVVCSRVSDLAYKLLSLGVGGNPDGSLLWLSAFAHGIDLTVVAITQSAVGGCRKEAHRILLMIGYLCLLAVESAMVYVQSAALFAQIVERLAVGRPHRVAVLTVECSQLPERVAALEPYVASDRRAVVLAPFVLIALAVDVEHISGGVDVEGIHGDVGKQFRTSAIHSYSVYLRVGACEDDRLGCWHDRSLEHDGRVVFPSQRIFAATVGRDAFGNTAVGIHYPHVNASFSIRGEGDVVAVGTPHWVGVESRIGGNLFRRATA